MQVIYIAYNIIMNNKQIYTALCQSDPSIPLFLTDWWMDAVCAGKQWDVLLDLDADSKPRAAMPFLIRERLHMRYIVMPQMTQIGGIWLRSDIQDDTDTVRSVCEHFARQIDDLHLSYYYQQYPIQSPVPDIMLSLGFKIKPKVTYRLEDLTDLDKVINAFSKNKKRQLQRALSLHADRQMTVEEFYQFHAQCLKEQGKQISYTREFLLVLERKASRQQQCQIIRISNADNTPLAAAFVVWDANTLYYLIPCYSPTYKDSGAGALLALEAIKLAREKNVTFDFEGSMIRGVANHYKQFGTTPTTYYSIERYYNPLFHLAIWWNELRQLKCRL